MPDNQLRVYQLWIDGSPTEIFGEFTKRQITFINESYASEGINRFWCIDSRQGGK